MGPRHRGRGPRLWSEKGREGWRDGVFTPEPGAAPVASSAPTVPSHGHAEGREGLPRPELCWRRPLALSPAAVVSTEPRHPGRQDVSGLVVGPPARSAQPRWSWPLPPLGPTGRASSLSVPVRLGLCGVSTEVSVPGAPRPYLGPLPVRGSPKEPPSQKLTRPSTGRPTPPRAWLCRGPNPEQGPGRWG